MSDLITGRRMPHLPAAATGVVWYPRLLFLRWACAGLLALVHKGCKAFEAPRLIVCVNGLATGV